jgi:hypothetical protein
MRKGIVLLKRKIPFFSQWIVSLASEQSVIFSKKCN